MAANETAIPDDSHPSRYSDSTQVATSELPPFPPAVTHRPRVGCGLQHCCTAELRAPCEAGGTFVVASCLCFLLPWLVGIGVVWTLDDVVGEPIALLVAAALWWLTLRGIRWGRCVLRRWSHAAS